ncbi:hypothetical protein [Algoriphagus zhangzhouensis]|uniref:hypothetical protein n=1 Tax=Algoriphagus zhangzhouensis TaxID=1073327 RepID=UPI0009375200|nr:hypothetical protein [Algoriphagus zhangzhouensis]
METSRKSNIETPRELINWSRWMIGINFSAGTGCVVVLRDIKSSASSTVSFWLLTAITLFAFTILTSIIFNLILSLEIKDDFTLKKKHWILGGFQLGLFTMALFALLAWITA